MDSETSPATSPSQVAPGDASGQAEAAHQTPVRRPKSRRRIWLFRMLAFGLAVGAVLLAEGLCRLAGFGGYPPVWKSVLENKNDGGRLYETNPLAMQAFFPRRISSGVHAQGSFRYERVLMPKPKGMIRVAVVGESSVEGFPFPRNLTAVSFLEAYLQAYHPGKPLEVLNLGVTAVASYPVRIIAEESLATLDLDLLVIYTGHNEFYGASGVASTQTGFFRWGGHDGSYLLRKLAIFQAFSRLVSGGNQADYKRPDNMRINLIEEMAAIASIEPGGKLHREAARVLELNLRAMIAAARQRGVPVVLSTLASNEKDLRPIQVFGHGAAEIAAEALAILEQAIPTAQALQALDALAADHPLNAMIWWARGTVLHKAGRTEDAARDFAKARDLDAMPWRATSAINQVIRDVARDENVLLVDAEAAFRAEADGAAGWDLMADHLHPSIEGQGLLAETLARAIALKELLPGAKPDARVPPRADLARALGANRLELAEIHGRMAALFDNPPLGINNKDAAAMLRQRMRDATANADAVELSAIAAWNAAQSKGPQTPSISFLAGLSSMEAGDFNRAAAYFASARLSMTPFGATRLRAQYFNLLCLRQKGPFDPARERMLMRALSEGFYVEALAEKQHLGSLYAAMGGLNLLAGQQEAGRGWLKRAMAEGFELGDAEAALIQKLIMEQDAAKAQQSGSQAAPAAILP